MLGLPREPFLLLGLNGGQSSPQDNSTGRPHWEGRTTTHYEALRGTTRHYNTVRTRSSCKGSLPTWCAEVCVHTHKCGVQYRLIRSVIQIACMPLASDQIITLQNLLKVQHTCYTNTIIDRVWRSVKKSLCFHPSRYMRDTKCHFSQKKSSF